MTNTLNPLAFLYLVLGLSTAITKASAQVDFNHYSARKNHSAASIKLIGTLTVNLRHEIDDLDRSENFQVLRQLNAARIKHIVTMVEQGAFIKDDSLETYANNVLQHILDSNDIAHGLAQVLILDSPHINAYCFGRGVYVITVGLLGRISNEDELAFTIAHEVTHDVLGHVRSRLIREADVSLAKKSREQVEKIVRGTIDVKDVLEYRALIYGASQHNRAREMEADSMGISLMQNSAYDQNAAFSMLTALDESLKPKFDIGTDLIWPLHDEEYPLQEGWFNERLSIYSRGYTDSYLYSVDSVESHPDVSLRMKRIENYLRNDMSVRYHQSEEFVEAVTLLAEFETVQSAYERKSFDRCLYYALQLLNRYPQNPFLVSRIATVLVSLCEAKFNNDNSFQTFVPPFTANYSDELTLVNNLLHNLSAKELGEVAFHFLDNPERFNPNEQSHYYLLWRISELTYRRDIADDIKKTYRERFNKNIAGYKIR